MLINKQINNKKKGPKKALFKYTGNVLLSHASFPRSTIGAVGLNFRVRDGIGCSPYAIVTGKFMSDRITISSIQVNQKK